MFQLHWWHGARTVKVDLSFESAEEAEQYFRDHSEDGEWPTSSSCWRTWGRR